MTEHLTDRELEEALGGQAPPAHLAQCEGCRARLAEQRAIRGRLQSACGSIRASEELAARIRRELAAARASAPLRTALRMHRWYVPLASAAAVLLLAGFAIFQIATSQPAAAAQAELAQIHKQNLADGKAFFTDADPQALARYFKEKLGFTPAFPRLQAGMSLRGCCVAHFRDKPVGAYVVDSPRGIISVIVLEESPHALGIKEAFRHGQRVYQHGTFAANNMVTLRRGGYTYCAVGEVPTDLLAELLGQLVD